VDNRIPTMATIARKPLPGAAFEPIVPALWETGDDAQAPPG